MATLRLKTMEVYGSNEKVSLPDKQALVYESIIELKERGKVVTLELLCAYLSGQKCTIKRVVDDLAGKGLVKRDNEKVVL